MRGRLCYKKERGPLKEEAEAPDSKRKEEKREKKSKAKKQIIKERKQKGVDGWKKENETNRR